MAGFPMPGQRIGPYLVVRELGRGPTGVVLEGLDTTAAAATERVALKVRTPLTSLAPDLRSRYGSDLDALAATRSPRLLPVLRVGVHGDRLLSVTPYAGGGDVAARLAAGPLEPATALAWATALAEGLAAVHAAGRVHGAVHARNLLLPGADAAPLLADVGGALLGQAWLRPPGAPDPVATPPEGGAPSPAADVWAAGRLLDELFGGAPAPQVAAVVRRATDPDPQRRYPDGAALARALELVPAGAAGPSEARTGRRRGVVALAGLGAAAVVAGALVLHARSQQPQPAPAASPASASPTVAAAPVVDSARPTAPRVGAAPGYRSVVFTLRAPAGAGVQVRRGSGWEDVATRTVTVPTTAGGDRACLQVRAVVDGRTSPPARACGASQQPELATVRQPDCLVDGSYRQVCYALVARGFAPGRDETLVFTVDGRPMGTATIHIARDGTGGLPGGQHFHFADADAGATARIEMAGVSHTWQVDRRS